VSDEFSLRRFTEFNLWIYRKENVRAKEHRRIFAASSSTFLPEKVMRILYTAVLVGLLNFVFASPLSAQCTGTNPSGAPAANGLFSEYYAGYFADNLSFFSNAGSLVRTDATINFPSNGSWGTIVPPAAAGQTVFSTRHRGQVLITAAGSYTFYLTSDDAGYLWVGANAFSPTIANATINNGGEHAPITQTATVNFPSAGNYDLLMLYGNNTAGSTLQLEYESTANGIARQIIPTSALCTALQPPAGFPQSISYSTNSITTTFGTAVSSVTPTVLPASPTPSYSLITSGLPSGITINSATGVISASGTVPVGVYTLSVQVANSNGSVPFVNVFTLRVNPAPPPGCSGQAGLTGDYFTTDFSPTNDFTVFAGAPAVTRTDFNINFPDGANWNNNVTAVVPPISGTATNPQNFSVRWRGSIYAATAGVYTFYLSSDDASWMWVGNNALSPTAANAFINNGGSHGTITVQNTVFLTAGLTNVLIYYGQGFGLNNATLEYESPSLGIARQIVPAGTFCTTVQPTITGLPVSISYTPNFVQTPVGTAVSSVTPTVNDGGSPITQYVITNQASLPAGISINSSTGVITANASVPVGVYEINVTLVNANGATPFTQVFGIQVNPLPPAGCSGVAGLQSDYFNVDFSPTNNLAVFSGAPVVSRTDRNIDFPVGANWNLNATPVVPTLGGTATNPQNFSVRWRGSILIPTTGSYTFYLTSDDGSFLWVDNDAIAPSPTVATALINNGGSHGPITVQGTTTLAAGLRNILVYYGQGGGPNTAQLEYSGPSIPRQVVPQSVLCTTVQPANPIVPQSITYTPNTITTTFGTPITSVTPVINDGGSPITTIAIINAGLPSGITINTTPGPNFGQVTADGTVPDGTYQLSIQLTNANGSATFVPLTIVVNPVPPPGCASNGGNFGFRGEYFNTDFSPTNDFTVFNGTPFLTRTDPNINFPNGANWNAGGTIVPPLGGTATNPQGFSVRWIGAVFITTPGSYTFYLTSDDASWMWIDAATTAPVVANALINNGGSHAPVTVSGTTTLSSGYHPVLIYYGQGGGPNTVVFEYEGPGISRRVVPSSFLCDVPLPVELTDFSASPLENSVKIRWRTGTEIDNLGFILSRSETREGTYTELGSYRNTPTLRGLGTSQTGRQYEFTDNIRIQRGKTYFYKLQDVSLRGVVYTHPIKAVTLPEAYNLSQNFPNPFNPSTLIEFTLQKSGRTSLEVYNMLGQKVATLVNEQLGAGNYRYTWNAAGLPSGIYFYRIQSGTFNETKKMMLLK
jgi:hypothetical protein